MTQFKTAPCKLCGRPIVWATSLDGKRLPLDPRAVVYKVTRDELGHVRGERIAEEPPGEQAAFVSHFATCPNVGALDRAGANKKPGGGRPESGSVSP